MYTFLYSGICGLYVSMSVFCMPWFSRYMLVCGLLSRLEGIMTLLHQQGD